MGLYQLDSGEPAPDDTVGRPSPGGHAPQEHDAALVGLDQVRTVVDLNRTRKHEGQRASTAHIAYSGTSQYLHHSHVPILPQYS